MEEAAKAGRGAILWASHFVFGGTLIKMALAENNDGPSHLSRPEHGFSKTGFGIRVLNPIRCRSEDRLLKERIVIGRKDMPKTTRQINRVLKDNGILSITMAEFCRRLERDVQAFPSQWRAWSKLRPAL